MLDDGRLILFLFVLPCALVFQLRAKPRWPAFLVPACIAALLIGWIAVFLFSNLPPLDYLETSYSRLIMIPTFSAILYCADALIDWSGAQVKTEFAASPARLYRMIGRSLRTERSEVWSLTTAARHDNRTVPNQVDHLRGFRHARRVPPTSREVPYALFGRARLGWLRPQCCISPASALDPKLNSDR